MSSHFVCPLMLGACHWKKVVILIVAVRLPASTQSPKETNPKVQPVPSHLP